MDTILIFVGVAALFIDMVLLALEKVKNIYLNIYLITSMMSGAIFSIFIAWRIAVLLKLLG